jgi:hypothetical protein
LRARTLNTITLDHDEDGMGIVECPPSLAASAKAKPKRGAGKHQDAIGLGWQVRGGASVGV